MKIVTGGAGFIGLNIVVDLCHIRILLTAVWPSKLILNYQNPSRLIALSGGFRPLVLNTGPPPENVEAIPRFCLIPLVYINHVQHLLAIDVTADVFPYNDPTAFQCPVRR